MTLAGQRPWAFFSVSVPVTNPLMNVVRAARGWLLCSSVVLPNRVPPMFRLPVPYFRALAATVPSRGLRAMWMTVRAGIDHSLSSSAPALSSSAPILAFSSGERAMSKHE